MAETRVEVEAVTSELHSAICHLIPMCMNLAVLQSVYSCYELQYSWFVLIDCHFKDVLRFDHPRNYDVMLGKGLLVLCMAMQHSVAVNNTMAFHTTTKHCPKLLC